MIAAQDGQEPLCAGAEDDHAVVQDPPPRCRSRSSTRPSSRKLRGTARITGSPATRRSLGNFRHRRCGPGARGCAGGRRKRTSRGRRFNRLLERYPLLRSASCIRSTVAQRIHDPEEPDAVIPHVRICGGPGRATSPAYPTAVLAKTVNSQLWPSKFLPCNALAISAVNHAKPDFEPHPHVHLGAKAETPAERTAVAA